MRRVLDPETVTRVQHRALANGGRLRPFADGAHSSTVQWDVAGNCQSPVSIELHGRHSAEMGEKMVVVSNGENKPRFVQMEVACRQCDNCLRRRSAMWRIRGMSEWRAAPRTWLCTFTLSPTSLIRKLSSARVRLSRGGTDYEAMTEHEKFLEVEKEGFSDVQLWLKRLRKNTQSRLRYLAVSEAHKSGVPHWHLLLHEQQEDRPIRYDAALAGSWPLGFASYKLVRSAQAAGYVTKYLSKSLSARVRASKGYGGAEETITAALSGSELGRGVLTRPEEA